ncbi:MAG: DUF5054 domain-containing protein [Clostridia bacterium]|nr:DUF5054 domain-containing protein [Clostridia bacterium]
MSRTKKIILVFKTHVDIGFTDLAENVLQNYAGPMLRQVIETCRATGHMGPLKYVWTMPAWILWHITEHCDRALRPELDRLIEKGQIVWHALPFTAHTDLCAPEEYVQGLRYARLLSERYGKPFPVAGKMTDVPGHGLMLPELLDQAGIRFLHLGCNEFAAPPQVPPLFFWRSPAGGQVLTMYSKGGYGTGLLPPEDWQFPVWMALMHTHDNYGPHSAETIAKLAEEARAACPGAEVVCGTMDDFYRALAQCDLSSVPVVTEDLADTWIHGVNSYPAEVSLLRACRERARDLHRAYCAHVLGGGGAIPELRDLWDRYYEQVCLFEEHTWGADVKRWLGPDRVYDKKAFLAARETDPYRFMERSWNEQRSRAENGAVLLERIAERIPLPPREERAPGALRAERAGGSLTVGNHRYRLRFDEESGRIDELYDKKLGTALLKSREGRGVFSYRYDRYGSEDITEFLRSYAYRFTAWGIEDYGRVNYPECAHRAYSPAFEGYEIGGDTVSFHYSTGESAALYGDCRRLTLAVTLPGEGEELEVALTLEDKQATPYVESGSLILPLPGRSGYRLEKPAAVIDPETQIAAGANHALLNIEREVTAFGDEACLTVLSRDTTLLAIGAPGVYDHQRGFPGDRAPEMWFDLFNNGWGTNFPQWIEGTLRYRFVLWGSPRSELGASPGRAASVASGADNPLPGLPGDMELVHTRQERDTLCITLRDHGGKEETRRIRVPGMQIAGADLLGRVRGPWRKDETEVRIRPYGLHCFALKPDGDGRG